MSAIPTAREIIAAVIPDVSPEVALKLEEALGLMTRRPFAKPKSPSRSAPVDARTAAAIRRHAKAFPKHSLQQIAAAFGTNTGRVSEALHFDR